MQRKRKIILGAIKYIIYFCTFRNHTDSSQQSFLFHDYGAQYSYIHLTAVSKSWCKIAADRWLTTSAGACGSLTEGGRTGAGAACSCTGAAAAVARGAAARCLCRIVPAQGWGRCQCWAWGVQQTPCPWLCLISSPSVCRTLCGCWKYRRYVTF